MLYVLKDRMFIYGLTEKQEKHNFTLTFAKLGLWFLLKSFLVWSVILVYFA